MLAYLTPNSPEAFNISNYFLRSARKAGGRKRMWVIEEDNKKEEAGLSPAQFIQSLPHIRLFSQVSEGRTRKEKDMDLRGG